MFCPSSSRLLPMSYAETSNRKTSKDHIVELRTWATHGSETVEETCERSETIQKFVKSIVKRWNGRMQQNKLQDSAAWDWPRHLRKVLFGELAGVEVKDFVQRPPGDSLRLENNLRRVWMCPSQPAQPALQVASLGRIAVFMPTTWDLPSESVWFWGSWADLLDRRWRKNKFAWCLEEEQGLGCMKTILAAS